MLLFRQLHQTALDDAHHPGGQRILRHHPSVVVLHCLKKLGQKQGISIRILINFVQVFRIAQQFLRLNLNQFSRFLQSEPFQLYLFD